MTFRGLFLSHFSFFLGWVGECRVVGMDTIPSVGQAALDGTPYVAEDDFEPMSLLSLLLEC